MDRVTWAAETSAAPINNANASPTRDAAADAGALGAGATGLGAAAITVVAATCCVSPVLAPLIVGVLGASGAAWAAGLKPYSGYILVASLLLLVGGFWSVYRPRGECVVPGHVISPSRRLLSRISRGVLWAGAVCWIAAATIHLILP